VYAYSPRVLISILASSITRVLRDRRMNNMRNIMHAFSAVCIL